MSGPNEENPLTYLEVTNHNDFEIELYFQGEPYTWAPGESVNCTTEAAAHIFGFGLPKEGVKSRIAAFHRLGWISTNPGCDYKGAMAKLAKISFKPVEQVFQMPTGEERAGRGRRRKRDQSAAVNVPSRPAGESSGEEDEDSSELPATPDSQASF